MKHLFHLFALVIFTCNCISAYAATYLMPISGTTTVTAAAGDLFYDSGNVGGLYTNSETGTYVFNTASGCLQFSFSTFNTQNGVDFLYVYDGPDATYPLIGQFSGIISPGTITSSIGSLTFVFKSNSSQNRIGWAATIAVATCPPVYDIKTNNGQTISTCSAVFYDSQINSNYLNNENYTVTFSSSLGNCIQALIFSYAISAGDNLTVYDGTSTAAPLIGVYTNGTKLPTRWISSGGSLTFNFTSNGTGQNKGWIIGLTCTTCPATIGTQTVYLQPTTGYQSTYCGANMVNTCSGIITDDGGLLGNYSDSICAGCFKGYYRTFCPTTALNCLRIQFYEIKINGTSFNGQKDNLLVLNGPTQYNLPLPNGNNITGVTCSGYDNCMGLGFGPYTSSDPSGCVTIAFKSNDDLVTDAGWKATIDCIPCSYGPKATDNNDCKNATAICSNTSIVDGSTGPGLISEGDPINSCVVSENFTNWYKITIATGGTLGFTIAPTKVYTNAANPGDDYDFALYGPSTACGTLGVPVRCSYAWSSVSLNPTNKTGINTATNATFNDGSVICGPANNGSDVSETVCGNSWVDDLTVIAGETYYLMVNNFYAQASGFDLTWALTNGASLNCISLPVSLTDFTCEATENFIALNWETASEFNNDHFVIERSVDGENYTFFNSIQGKGTSLLSSEYFITDNHPAPGINYYRLSQVDNNGIEEKLKITSCNYENTNEEVTLNVFDMSGALLFSKLIMSSELSQTMYNLPLTIGVYVTSMQHKNGSVDLGKYLKLN